MAMFLLKSTYTVEGIKGLTVDGGTKRVEVVRKMIEGVGGRMESMYFGFGADDTYVVCDLPDTRPPPRWPSTSVRRAAWTPGSPRS